MIVLKKSFLADFPELLLTDSHYSLHFKIAELSVSNDVVVGQTVRSEARLLRGLQLMLLLLPTESRVLLQDILLLLHLAAKHEEQNKMSSQNVAPVFALHLSCPRKMSPEVLPTNYQIMSQVMID